MSLRPRSIVGWFVLCWSFFLVASVVVGALLISLYVRSTTERLRHAATAVARGCDEIAGRYRFLVAGTETAPDLGRPDLRRGLTDAVRLALRNLEGVEGGVWQVEAGSLGYAYPTYEGTGEKTDVPEAELPAIRNVAEAAALDGVPVERRQDGRFQTLLLRACPLPGPIPHLAAWTMTRVATVGGREFATAAAGLGALLIVVLASAAWLGHVLLGWSRRLRSLEAALDSGAGEIPRLASTGQRDLDRIVEAVNRAGLRLAEARQFSDRLARQVADTERLAALGRVAAGVAHEIRNPIAAMRLKAENALAAGDSERAARALDAILGQIERLDRLVRDLLGSVPRNASAPESVDVAAFLAARAELFREQAERAGLTLATESAVRSAAFDPARIARALDNLILNAIENTPPAGRILLSAAKAGDVLALSVADTGRGVPEALRDRLFEPFVTGRAEGTGLGLAIVREIAQSHGGRVRTVHRSDGTTFVLELPWRES